MLTGDRYGRHPINLDLLVEERMRIVGCGINIQSLQKRSRHELTLVYFSSWIYLLALGHFGVGFALVSRRLSSLGKRISVAGKGRGRNLLDIWEFGGYHSLA